ncbi:hypothetical protein HYPSUDRAFT_47582 [Hypholoma sublateritium FD-334 SS-4]|uniref:Uncharacterized protein n=1 Tax=Hypholoma sublateritium (strain FD-334 SS-4) TaxID=945553 RepID=A0A0D2NI20_HYPSF|nr:hypothetical protein HYPSUDRAFT_47582 [Hypholoma sublateritium FD-334 SS-4]
MDYTLPAAPSLRPRRDVRSAPRALCVYAADMQASRVGGHRHHRRPELQIVQIAPSTECALVY